MTAGEFRLIIDSRYRTVKTAAERCARFAEYNGYRERTVRSWYYGERPIPEYAENAARPVRSGNVQLNASLRLLGAELDRLEQHVEAVRRMCLTCEPEGQCHQPKCELRPVSPLRLSVRGAA